MKRLATSLQMALLVFVVMYQSNSEFRDWVDYQLLRAFGWAGYAVSWGQWSLRRRIRRAKREREEAYGPDVSPEV